MGNWHLRPWGGLERATYTAASGVCVARRCGTHSSLRRAGVGSGAAGYQDAPTPFRKLDELVDAPGEGDVAKVAQDGHLENLEEVQVRDMVGPLRSSPEIPELPEEPAS